MLDFINWFFSFFGSFVDFLSRCEVFGDITLGMLLVSVMIVVMVGRFLVGSWKYRTVGGSVDKGGSDE